MRFLGGKCEKKIGATTKAIDTVASLGPSAERKTPCGVAFLARVNACPSVPRGTATAGANFWVKVLLLRWSLADEDEVDCHGEAYGGEDEGEDDGGAGDSAR